VAVARRTEPGASKDDVANEQEVALALVDLFGDDGVVAGRAEPICKCRSLTRTLDEPELGHIRSAVDQKAAVRGVHHVRKASEWFDQLDFVPEF
jgi:hypothetical protein